MCTWRCRVAGRVGRIVWWGLGFCWRVAVCSGKEECG